MKLKARIEITKETEREISFRFERRQTDYGAKCGKCGGELVSINEAAAIASINWREIVRLIETGEIHSSETASGEIFLCGPSLFNLLETNV